MFGIFMGDLIFVSSEGFQSRMQIDAVQEYVKGLLV